MRINDYKIYFLSDYCDLLCCALTADNRSVPVVGFVLHTLYCNGKNSFSVSDYLL